MRGTWGDGLSTHPLRVRISYTLDGIKAQTGFVLRDQSATPSNPQDCAENVGAFCNASFKTILSFVDRLDGVDVVDLTTGESGGFSFQNVIGSLPQNNANNLPPFITAPVSMKSELRRRYGQGRMLLPVRPEELTFKGDLNGDGVALYNGLIAAFQSEYMATPITKTYRLITVHGVIPARGATATSPARPEVPASWYDVQTLRLNTKLSFLRSRKY